MPIFLYTAIGWAKTALTALLALARRYPREVAIVALLCLSAWLWHGKSKAQEQTRAIAAAAERAEKDLLAAIKRQQDNYNQLAKETDDAHRKALADAGDRTDRFIAARRVRPETCRAASPAPAGQGEVAGTPEVAPAEAVLVDVSDVRACSAASVYAQSSYEWAQKLLRDGLAE